MNPQNEQAETAIVKPGIYDMPFAEYLADPCPEPSFSSSAAIAILSQSPQHVWHEHPKLNPNHREHHKTAFDIGSAAHAMFLEGDDSNIKVIEADDWRKKDAKAARDAAYAEGLTPLLSKHHRQIVAVVEASHRAWKACAELNDADVWAYNLTERSALWTEDGIWCRARPDLLADDHTIIVNYKTTGANAEPDAFGHGLLTRSGYHLQAYHHLRGIEKLKGVQAKYVWMVQEIEPPYACSFIGMSPSLRAFAELQWFHALSMWRECLADGKWPGYPNRICWFEVPGWEVTRWAARPDVEGVLDAMELIGDFAK